MKTKTLVLFLLFLFSVVGTIFSVSNSFAQDSCWPGGSGSGCTPPKYGCTDFTARNYDPSAEVDNGSCKYGCPPWTPGCTPPPIKGCTDSRALNYSSSATQDDGSCQYSNNSGIIYFYCAEKSANNYQTQAECREENKARVQDSCIINKMVCKYDTILSCNNSQAINYTSEATSDTSCIFTFGKGNCTDPKALNYNKNARNGDRSCVYDFTIRNCTDSLALNYNPNARRDDGSCIYTYGTSGCTEPKALNYNPNATINNSSSCVYNLGNKAGCTDSKASNYNSNAIIDDGSCEYLQWGPIAGCTDPKAGNYNPNATVEDGSCLMPSGKSGCIDAQALNYNPDAIIDDGSCKYTQAESTLCLRRDFNSMPNFSDMIAFNNAYKICSNGGNFTKTGSLIQWSLWSFSGYCENSAGIDNNKDRCTYTIIDDIEVFRIEPPFFITGNVSGVGGTQLPNIEVTLTTSLWETRTTTTDSAGNYIFNGLGVGDYSIRPDNSMPYIFPHSEVVTLSDSNATVNFVGIDTTTVVTKTNFATLLNKDSSIEDWLKDLSDRWNNVGGNIPDALDVATLTNARNNGSIFSNNSLSSLFNNGFLPLSNSYTPIPLSLVPKYADINSVCGDGKKQTGETCDDGVNNGKSGYCSSDCLYRGEVKFIPNNARDYTNESTETWTVSLQSLAIISDTVGRNVSGGMKILQTSIRKATDSIGTSQNFLKQKIIENTSPRTREILKQTAEIVAEVAQYSVIAVASLVAAFAGALHIMAYKAQWVSYTVKPGDTIDSLGNKFTMTERAMRSKNGLKKWELRPGTKIKVRNRHLIEKDYLDQLKFVLQDSLEKRNYGKMSAKIDKMFAKK